MPVATPNTGESIGKGNTGYNASDLTPISLSTHTGQFNTTANGQVVEGLDITGHVRVRHDNVTFRRCRIHASVWHDPIGTPRKGLKIENCEIGVDTGYEARSFNQNNGSGIRGYDLLVWRTNIYGFEDIISPLSGNHIIAQCYIHHPYHDLSSDNYVESDGSRGDSHNDPVQPPGNRPPGWSSLLVAGCRFETFYFEKGGRASTTGTTMNGPSTAGCINIEHGNCRNTTIRDCYIDGDYSQCMYFISGNNNQQSYSPGPNVVIDNIFVHRRAIFGAKSFINSGQSVVTWGGSIGNRRKDNNELLTKPFYTSYQGNPNGSWTQAGASSSYPNYGGPPPGGGGGPGDGDPQTGIGVVISSPSDGATFTTGGFTFLGGADTSEEVNDSNTNYNFFDYYVSYSTAENPEVSAEAFLDHDSATNNTGFAFSGITDEGVTFVDRSSVQHTVRGEMTLILRGRRKDGSTVTDTISVTVGTPVLPPVSTSDIEFTPTMEAEADGVITINTATGGIGEAVERVPVLIPVTYRTEWYWRDSRNLREVIFVGATPVYRGQE